MSGISTRRCSTCHEVVLVADHGRVKTVGETRYVETLPNGDTRYRCICGVVVLWQFQSAENAVR